MNEPRREKTCLLGLPPEWMKPIHVPTKRSKIFKTVDVLNLAMYVNNFPVVAQTSSHLTLLYDSQKKTSGWLKLAFTGCDRS